MNGIDIYIYLLTFADMPDKIEMQHLTLHVICSKDLKSTKIITYLKKVHLNSKGYESNMRVMRNLLTLYGDSATSN